MTFRTLLLRAPWARLKRYFPAIGRRISTGQLPEVRVLKKRQLLGATAKNRAASMGRRNRLFMANRRIEIGLRLEPGFDSGNELIQTPKPVELVPIAEPPPLAGSG